MGGSIVKFNEELLSSWGSGFKGFRGCKGDKGVQRVQRGQGVQGVQLVRSESHDPNNGREVSVQAGVQGVQMVFWSMGKSLQGGCSFFLLIVLSKFMIFM